IDQHGCHTDTSVNVIPYDVVRVAFDTAVIEINYGQEVTLTPIIQPDDSAFRYSWTPETGLSCTDCRNPAASPVISTTYWLTVFDVHGCPASAQIRVDVTNNLVLVVPNAFTPNGDLFNDILYVYYQFPVASVRFRIFNRWGEKIFETKNINDGWDGSNKGKPQPPGVYVYYVEAVFTDGQEKQIKGSVTILK
ncbi:MAG TPA: gliding motility-associated C-terminal domain-containing protein, partial [Chitinophagales bacterium]|nr:gliding motility-associated C-terminal domain-containing protein [Chitinophagales bacterium]